MSGGQPNILLPLVIVVSVSAIKDLLEDMKRRRADKEENEREVLVLDPEHGFEVRHWQDLQQGSIVKITKNQPFPSDLILLSATEKHEVDCERQSDNNEPSYRTS
jgi:phospholipid-transporting ATPase